MGKIIAATHEIKAIMDDYRMQAIGVMMGAWDLWNLAVIPSLLNNYSTWLNVTNKKHFPARLWHASKLTI